MINYVLNYVFGFPEDGDMILMIQDFVDDIDKNRMIMTKTFPVLL